MTKTMTYAALHFTIAFSVAWLLTGDILVGGLVALVEPTINSVAYFFHEKFWAAYQQRKAAGRDGDNRIGGLNVCSRDSDDPPRPKYLER
jgi:uncharacterized membrane protein